MGIHLRQTPGTPAKAYLLAGIGLACLVLSSCASVPIPNPESEGLGSETAAQYGYANDFLVNFRQRLAAHGDIDGFLVAIDNNLIFEQYGKGYDAQRVHDLQSSTKSINALLVGILASDGILDVGASLASLYPERSAGQEFLSRVTVQNLLDMSSGVDWHEMGLAYLNADGSPNSHNDNVAMNSNPDWAGWALDRFEAAEFAPGSRFDYNSGNAIILGDIVRRASGQNVARFAQDKLFTPLGIAQGAWLTQTGGSSVQESYLALDCIGPEPDLQIHTGGGLRLRPRDMLKIGFLVANQGVWNGRQILSADWIAALNKPGLPVPDSPMDYANQWWHVPMPDGSRALFTAGFGGQHIVIIPARHVVAVVTAHMYEDPNALNVIFSGIWDFLTHGTGR